jgi:glutamyl-Q tRNA(Asp) synthetase
MAAMGAGVPARGYRGRFAPSPTGLLHEGSLVAALASWLDARAHRGTWLVRIEDVDAPRCVHGADRAILDQLAALGLAPDEPPLWQSARAAQHQAALVRLLACGWAYACACSRSDIVQALAARGAPRARHGDLVYPGTCRTGLNGRPARALRMLAARSPDAPQLPENELHVAWRDRRLGAQQQNVSAEVGDYVLRRADGLWAYQLAVVVDDAAQGITDVVRGEDLADNTPRQIHLQRALGVPMPRYLHTPLVLGRDGEKLSKQNGAEPIDTADPLVALQRAGRVLGLEVAASEPAQWLPAATAQWAARWLD